MNRILDVVRAIFISFEFAWVLFVMATYFLYPQILFLIGAQFKTNAEIWKWLPTLPLLFSTAAFQAAAKLRAPLENASNRKLYEWQDYYRITDRVYLGLFLCILSCIGATVIWIFTSHMNEMLIAGIFLVSTGVSGVVAFIMYVSGHKLRELVDKYSK